MSLLRRDGFVVDFEGKIDSMFYCKEIEDVLILSNDKLYTLKDKSLVEFMDLHV